MKTEPKFNVGQIVEGDVLNEKVKVVKVWWEDKTYHNKNGSWMYRVGFMTKSGDIHKTKHHRVFDECRLTPAA